MEQEQQLFGFINALTTQDDSYGLKKDETEMLKNDYSAPPPPPPPPPPLTSSATSSSHSVQYHDITSSSPHNCFDIQSKSGKKTQSIATANDAVIQRHVLDSSSSSSTNRLIGAVAVKRDALKKRKRIVLLNDEDDSDDEKGSMTAANNVSCNVEKSQEDKSEQVEKKSLGGEEADVESGESDDEAVTVVNPAALKAKFLLKSAIIIQDPEQKKRKKSRVLVDSDDDELQQMEIQTSVDDIGLEVEHGIGPENENVVENVSADIIILSEPPPSSTLGDVQVKNEGVDAQANLQSAVDIEDLLDRIKPMADDDDFFKYDKSSEEEEKPPVNNEDYFGLPDKSAIPNAAKKRGPRLGARRRLSPNQKMKQRRGDRYEKDFVDDSGSSDDSDSSDYSDSLTSSESSSSDSSVEEVQEMKLSPRFADKKSIPISTPPITLTRVASSATKPRELAKKDRFYDQSRNIPDSVYFGDVKVPLHILHTKWNSSVEEKRINKNQPQQQHHHHHHLSVSSAIRRKISPVSNKTQHPYVESDDPKLSTLKDLVRITGIKINYSRLFDGIKSTDHKCMIIKRILAQKGLEGEPTVAKCRKLKRDLQAKRESAELDKSVIITDQGRTRRARRSMPAAKYNDIEGQQPNDTVRGHLPLQTLETLSKIRSVIDSDSE